MKKKQSKYAFVLFEVHITLGFQSEVSAFIYFSVNLQDAISIDVNI
jgi:hypothetical protein